MNEKIEALAEFLDVESEEIEQTTYDENTFTYGSQEYMVLNDEEADKKTEEYIRESLWAFNANFILNHSKIEDCGLEVLKAFEEMQEKLCESANELVYALIEDFDDFVQDAIDADGRGHFISQYDGEENEVKVNNEWLYIYRTN